MITFENMEKERSAFFKQETDLMQQPEGIKKYIVKLDKWSNVDYLEPFLLEMNKTKKFPNENKLQTVYVKYLVHKKLCRFLIDRFKEHRKDTKKYSLEKRYKIGKEILKLHCILGKLIIYQGEFDKALERLIEIVKKE